MIQNIKEFITKINWFSSKSSDHKISELLLFWNELSKIKKKKYKDLLPEWFIEVYYNDPGVDFLKVCSWEIEKALDYKKFYFKARSEEFKNILVKDKKYPIYIPTHEIYHTISLPGIHNSKSILWKQWLPRLHTRGYLLIDELPQNMSESDFYQFKIKNNLSLDEELRLYVEHCSPKVRDSIKDCIDPIIPEILETIHPLHLYCTDFNIQRLKIDCEFFKAWSKEDLKKELGKDNYSDSIFNFCRTYYPDVDAYPITYLSYLSNDLSEDILYGILYQHLLLWKDIE